MKISLENPTRINLIRRCAPDGVQIGEQVFTRSLIVTPMHIDAAWQAVDASRLDLAAVAPIDALDAEIVLLGTGPRQVFPAPALFAHFASRRIGLEVMDNAAACRTYNVLVSEGRRAVCALILRP
jgi:uncharacterized protein